MKYLYVFVAVFFFNTSTLAQSVVEKPGFTIAPKTYKSSSGNSIDAMVGTLKVKENRAIVNSDTISIAFIQLKSTSANPGSPIFYLEGGPGSSCTWQADDPESLDNWLPYLALGDVVLIDQRGTGAGTPRVLYIWEKEIPEDVFISAEGFKQHFEAVNKAAIAEFKSRGVDLNGYTTIENAKDIDELRQALQYDKISLFGFSYGTHLGQAYIKYYTKHVNNAILVGVEGLNHTYKLPMAMDLQFHKIALMAKKDSNVKNDVPDLVELYKKVIQKLKSKPAEVKIKSPLTEKPITVKVGPFGLNLILRLDVGDASDIPVFPRLLYTIEQGNYDLLKWFVQKRYQSVFGIHGMSSTMDAASGASESRLLNIKAQKKTSLFKNVVNPNFESNWPSPDLGASFRSPLISNTRTLFMSGTLDFNTPPYQAEEVRWGFSNSSHIIVTNAGHEQILSHPMATASIIRFLKGEQVNDVALSYEQLKFIPVSGKTGKLSHPSIK